MRDNQLTLRVDQAAFLAEGIRGFSLIGEALPDFEPGAHLRVHTPSGLVRRYSLTNAPGDSTRYDIAVKREGRGSASLIDDVQIGDELQVEAPICDFRIAPAAVSHIFIAGGIGITPFMSMASHLIATGGKPFRLYYLARTPELMAFRDELSTPDFRGRVIMHCDNADPAQAYDLWPILERQKGAHVYCCGPRGLMESVRDMTGHWSSAAVHFEDFGTSAKAEAVNTRFQIRLAKSNRTIEVPPDQTALEALRAANITIASSCESGSCGTCRVAVLEGQPDHRDLVLTPSERTRYMMVCVSRATTAELVLDL